MTQNLWLGSEESLVDGVRGVILAKLKQHYDVRHAAWEKKIQEGEATAESEPKWDEKIENAKAGMLHLLAVRENRRLRFNAELEYHRDNEELRNKWADEDMSFPKIMRRILSRDIKAYLVDVDPELAREQMIVNPYGLTDVCDGEWKAIERIEDNLRLLKDNPTFLESVEEITGNINKMKKPYEAEFKAIEDARESLLRDKLIDKTPTNDNYRINDMGMDLIPGDFKQSTQDFIYNLSKTALGHVERLIVSSPSTQLGKIA